MIADDLVDYLTSAGAVSSGAMFGRSLPDTPAAAVGLIEYGGLPGVHAMSTGPGNVVLEQPRVQIVVRDETYALARITIQQIGQKLDGLRARTINGIQYHHAEALQPPMFLYDDENGRVVLAQNYQILKARSTTS